MTNSYDLRCSWCDQRFPDKQARIHHEQEEHGTVTDEQVNRIMSGQDKMWDTHDHGLASPGLAEEVERLGLTAVVRDLEARHPYGPGLNVTVPRAPLPPGFAHMREFPQPDAGVAAPDEHFAPYPDDITEADIVETMRAQGLGLPPVALVTAGAICQQAADITAGDRQQQNGDKLPNHENIAALWSAYLGVPIDAHQAATMMVLLKVARTKLGAFNTDDYVDMAGYAGCAAEIRHRSNQEQQ